MFKNIIGVFIIVFLITSSSSAEEINTGLIKKQLDTQSVPALYIEMRQENGGRKQEKLVLTNENKNLLKTSLEGIISLFEETNERLRRKNSDFEIKEVEIYASLQGEASVVVLKGAAEASFKIILYPVGRANRKIRF